MNIQKSSMEIMSISHRLQNKVTYWPKIAVFTPPPLKGDPAEFHSRD